MDGRPMAMAAERMPTRRHRRPLDPLPNDVGKHGMPQNPENENRLRCGRSRSRCDGLPSIRIEYPGKLRIGHVMASIQ